MHIFAAIVAAGITLYLLRNAWERFQIRRQQKLVDIALNPARWGPVEPSSQAGAWVALAIAIVIVVGMAALTVARSM